MMSWVRLPFNATFIRIKIKLHFQLHYRGPNRKAYNCVFFFCLNTNSLPFILFIWFFMCEFRVPFSLWSTYIILARWAFILANLLMADTSHLTFSALLSSQLINEGRYIYNIFFGSLGALPVVGGIEFLVCVCLPSLAGWPMNVSIYLFLIYRNGICHQ